MSQRGADQLPGVFGVVCDGGAVPHPPMEDPQDRPGAAVVRGVHLQDLPALPAQGAHEVPRDI